MKQWLRYPFFVPFMLATVTAHAADATATAPLHMRNGPGICYSVRTILPANHSATIVGPCKGNWCQISYKGHTGWSSKRYLSFKKGSPHHQNLVSASHKAAVPQKRAVSTHAMTASQGRADPCGTAVPKGAAGIPGTAVPKGAAGIPGTAVPKGAAGIPGTAVPKGAAGIPGTAVPKGAVGIPGTAVPKGAAGTHETSDKQATSNLFIKKLFARKPAEHDLYQRHAPGWWNQHYHRDNPELYRPTWWQTLWQRWRQHN